MHVNTFNFANMSYINAVKVLCPSSFVFFIYDYEIDVTE